MNKHKYFATNIFIQEKNHNTMQVTIAGTEKLKTNLTSHNSLAQAWLRKFKI